MLEEYSLKHLRSIFYENTARDLVDETLKEHFTAYKEGYPVDEVFLRGATAQIGAHLIEAIPQGWELKEKIRTVVAGVEYLVMSRRKKLDFFREAAIFHLSAENWELCDTERPFV